jgi:TPR repeat protein
VLENCLTGELRELWEEIRERENASFWALSDDWERSASNDFDLPSEEPEERLSLLQNAQEIFDSDPAAAFQLRLEAAEAGSVWAMEAVGWHYWTGTGVAADTSLALEYYHRAILGGSWSATIPYARLLAEVGRLEDCDKVLQDGVASDFAPAYFWLACLRYHRDRTTTVRREVWPLLEYAARQGHPAARVYLARWMAHGQLGLLNVPRGCVNMVREIVASLRRWD